ncbi:MAG: RNA polymerase sigma factor [Actinomycetota bacterium]|nr:RNA polymerase sigma factor [Actinomycetota bacterium]
MGEVAWGQPCGSRNAEAWTTLEKASPSRAARGYGAATAGPAAGRFPPKRPSRGAAVGTNLEELPDDELVVRARDRGDPGALDALVRRHRDTAYRVALRVCLNPADAEDVAQDALVRAWRSLPAFRGESSFGTWLYRIVTNLALKRVSRRREDAVAEPPEPPGPDLDPARRVEERERLAVAIAALQRLTPEQRACWTLRELEGLSYGQLAEVLGLTVPAVKSRLFRARSELAAALARYDRVGQEATP